MAGSARREVVREGQPGIYHCYQRLVRRAFLLGIDSLTGKNYNHRRPWFVERLKLLVANFAVDVAFFSIMSNHFHLVLRTYPRLVKRMGKEEIARRWLRVYPGKRVLDGNWIEPTDEQIQALVKDEKKLAKVRKRLSSISWFMAALSEYIARRANLEDGCDGRFFSGRFGCREITSEAGLLVNGIYVDLNQIRAGESMSPETSLHSSVFLRIQARRKASSRKPGEPADDAWLSPITLESDQFDDVPCQNGLRASDKGLFSMTVDDYLRLLDIAGREVRGDKKGAIPDDLVPILERLGINQDQFVSAIEKLPRWFPRMIGPPEELTERAQLNNRKWMHGVRPAAKLFEKTSHIGSE